MLILLTQGAITDFEQTLNTSYNLLQVISTIIFALFNDLEPNAVPITHEGAFGSMLDAF